MISNIQHSTSSHELREQILGLSQLIQTTTDARIMADAIDQRHELLNQLTEMEAEEEEETIWTDSEQEPGFAYRGSWADDDWRKPILL